MTVIILSMDKNDLKLIVKLFSFTEKISNGFKCRSLPYYGRKKKQPRAFAAASSAAGASATGAFAAGSSAAGASATGAFAAGSSAAGASATGAFAAGSSAAGASATGAFAAGSSAAGAGVLSAAVSGALLYGSSVPSPSGVSTDISSRSSTDPALAPAVPS